jgi:flagellar basal body-associated protein FliL
MAIVLEEEKKETNWVAVLIVIVIVAVLFAGVYFLFFKKPELIEVVAPKSLEDINKISQVSFNPQTVIEAPVFKLLRQYGTAVTPPTPGRPNPFKPF